MIAAPTALLIGTRDFIDLRNLGVGLVTADELRSLATSLVALSDHCPVLFSQMRESNVNALQLATPF